MFEEYHDRALETGIDAIGLTVAYGSSTFEAVQSLASKFLRHIYAAPDRYTMIRAVGDIRRAHESGKAGLFSIHKDVRLLATIQPSTCRYSRIWVLAQ